MNDQPQPISAELRVALIWHVLNDHWDVDFTLDSVRTIMAVPEGADLSHIDRYPTVADDDLDDLMGNFNFTAKALHKVARMVDYYGLDPSKLGDASPKEDA